MEFLLHTVIICCTLLFPALGYNVVFGKGKIMHFGQEATSLAAVYGLWVLVATHHLPYGVGLLVGALGALLVAALLAWLSNHLEPDGLGVMSIAAHLAALSVVLNWQSVTRGALGIPGIPRWPLPTTLGGYALVAIVVTALWVFALWLLDRSRFGRALAALSEHPWHAEALGISRKRVHLIAFFIAAAGSLLGAALYPPYVYLLTPSDYNFPAMIFFIMCVVAGGPGRLWGVLIATVALTFLKEGIRFVGLPAELIGPVRLMLFGTILYVAVWWRRDSVFPPQRSV